MHAPPLADTAAQFPGNMANYPTEPFKLRVVVGDRCKRHAGGRRRRRCLRQALVLVCCRLAPAPALPYPLTAPF
jgi:hypothetical protein